MAGTAVGSSGSSFLGADVDGLDRIGQVMDQAEDLANTVTTILEALATALEAMSWTGFAAAFAAFLRSTVIPWVKFAAKVFGFFSKVIKLASGEQKETSGDTVTVNSGNVTYNPPAMPTTSCGEAPRLSPVEVTITINTQGSDTGVQVTSPQLPGAVTPPGMSTGADGGSSSGATVPGAISGSRPAVVNPDGSPATVSPGSTATPVSLGSGGVDGGSAGGSAGGSGGTVGGSAGSGGSTGGSGSGANPSFSAGISSNPNGGLDYHAEIRGTIGGDPASSPGTPVGGTGTGSSSLDGAVPASSSPEGGVSPAMIAAPLGAAGLAAAALGAKGSGSSSGSLDGATDGGATGNGSAGDVGAGPGTGTGAPSGAGEAGTGGAAPAPTAPQTPGWRLVALQEADGSLDFAFAPDTDARPTVADLHVSPAASGADGSGDGTAAEEPRIVGWVDGDGDYGFVGEDVTVTTPAGEVTLDDPVVEGVLGEDEATTESVTDWWQDALDGDPATGSTDSTTDSTTENVPAGSTTGQAADAG